MFPSKNEVLCMKKLGLLETKMCLIDQQDTTFGKRELCRLLKHCADQTYVVCFKPTRSSTLHV